MQYTGVLQKMKSENHKPVQYYLNFKDSFVILNQLIDKNISITFKTFECLNCHKDKKIFRQGYCYDCFYKAPEVGDWVMKPELSKAHLDEEDRDLAFEKRVQLQPHIVYLSNTGSVKVGVTRKTQVPYRWIDQGAHEAIVVLETPNRYLAGIAEVALKEHISDKTKWRSMLKNEIEDLDLKEIKNDLKQYLPEETQEFFKTDEEEYNIEFPVKQYPQKVKSLNLSKIKDYKGKLIGIKGQYLLFEDQTVFNVRSHSGFVVDFNIS
ncbi:DUF2797 domain-containing protein [Flavobacteriaceae bacterium 14752]|uniref:DUF2797 domain-containing protein n=1 Tax=Mesohalobacter salilacus TaxID=2491711 RepID=UPI000F642ADA|nr:DUF2797 domain-containing protein [Flavobacteriaceae bacterium 14752]